MILSITMHYNPETRLHSATLPDGSAYPIKASSDVFGDLFAFLFCRPDSAYTALPGADIQVQNVHDSRANLTLPLREALEWGKRALARSKPGPAPVQPGRSEISQLLERAGNA
jgi:hypothetical protein